jgi:GNAT superfamily N-acetyltransferase
MTATLGTTNDAAELAALHKAVAEHLTMLYGAGPWSSAPTERGVLHGMRTSRVFVAREGGAIVATFRLATKRPWAIDAACFAKVRKPLYLVGMAVAPARQRQGVGRHCLEDAARIAREWNADAIRLDAFDAAAGAGRFYVRCGYSEVGRKVYKGDPLIYYELRLRSGSEPGFFLPSARRPSRS